MSQGQDKGSFRLHFLLICLSRPAERDGEDVRDGGTLPQDDAHTQDDALPQDDVVDASKLPQDDAADYLFRFELATAVSGHGILHTPLSPRLSPSPPDSFSFAVRRSDSFLRAWPLQRWHSSSHSSLLHLSPVSSFPQVLGLFPQALGLSSQDFFYDHLSFGARNAWDASPFLFPSPPSPVSFIFSSSVSRPCYSFLIFSSPPLSACASRVPSLFLQLRHVALCRPRWAATKRGK